MKFEKPNTSFKGIEVVLEENHGLDWIKIFKIKIWDNTRDIEIGDDYYLYVTSSSYPLNTDSRMTEKYTLKLPAFDHAVAKKRSVTKI